MQWTLRTNRPQPTTFYEKTPYLELMQLMLDRGADPNARLRKNLWYIGYNFPLERNNSSGTTPFWKAAAVGDLTGMRLLIEHGADPAIASIEGITPLLIASGAGLSRQRRPDDAPGPDAGPQVPGGRAGGGRERGRHRSASQPERRSEQSIPKKGGIEAVARHCTMPRVEGTPK